MAFEANEETEESMAIQESKDVRVEMDRWDWKVVSVKLVNQESLVSTAYQDLQVCLESRV